jgi:drug/metabolite transporter (DMT)-like permease
LIAVALALCASLGWGFADFGAGVASRRFSAFLVAAVSQATGAVVVAAALLASGRSAPGARELAWAAFGGVVAAIGLGAFYRALAVGTMGIIGPVASTLVVVPIAYGVARGERPSALQGVGLALAVVGVVGASLEQTAERRRVGAGVGLALVAAVCFGSALVALDRAAGGGIAWAVLVMRVVALPFVGLAALALRSTLPRGGRIWLLLLGVGFCDTGATFLYAAATRHGLLSVVAVLSSLYPIVIVALARGFLAERIARPQLAGVVVALAGVALISAG